MNLILQANMAVCKITDPYHNEFRNKPTISITVKRADYDLGSLKKTTLRLIQKLDLLSKFL